jgi:hypothetical protein
MFFSIYSLSLEIYKKMIFFSINVAILEKYCIIVMDHQELGKKYGNIRNIDDIVQLFKEQSDAKDALEAFIDDNRDRMTDITNLADILPKLIELHEWYVCIRDDYQDIFRRDNNYTCETVKDIIHLVNINKIICTPPDITEDSVTTVAEKTKCYWAIYRVHSAIHRIMDNRSNKMIIAQDAYNVLVYARSMQVWLINHQTNEQFIYNNMFFQMRMLLVNAARNFTMLSKWNQQDQYPQLINQSRCFDDLAMLARKLAEGYIDLRAATFTTSYLCGIRYQYCHKVFSKTALYESELEVWNTYMKYGYQLKDDYPRSLTNRCQ